MSGPGNADDGHRIADELERAHPQWMVVWGSFSRQFVAFPLFGPPRPHISAADPGELEHHMNDAERRYGNTKHERR
jgi:hypothetical protein